MKNRLTLYRTMAALMVVSLVGCSDSGPGAGFSNVAVSFSTQRSTPATSPSFSFGGDPITDGSGNTLTFASVELVLRQIELKRADSDACTDSGTAGDDDGCEEFSSGPVLIDLPLGPGVAKQVAIDIPPGVYDEIDFELHKLGDDPEDLAFIALHPDFEDISIRAIGQFNGTPFEFTTDINDEQELELNPALVIDENATTSTNVTIFLDIDGWFRLSNGTLFNPDTGNKGGENESRVSENIKNSFEAYEDEDEDGDRD